MAAVLIGPTTKTEHTKQLQGPGNAEKIRN
jgi:hypothetical protein